MHTIQHESELPICTISKKSYAHTGVTGQQKAYIAMLTLTGREAMLAGFFEVVILTSWPWDPSASRSASLMNLGALLATLAVPCALVDFICAQCGRRHVSLWAITASLRELCIIMIFLNPVLVMTLVFSVCTALTVAWLFSTRQFPRLYTVGTGLTKASYKGLYACMTLVLFFQKRGFHALIPLFFSYLPPRREVWMHILTTHWWFYNYTASFAS